MQEKADDDKKGKKKKKGKGGKDGKEDGKGKGKKGPKTAWWLDNTWENEEIQVCLSSLCILQGRRLTLWRTVARLKRIQTPQWWLLQVALSPAIGSLRIGRAFR